MGIQFGCSDNLWWELFEISSSTFELNSITYIIYWIWIHFVPILNLKTNISYFQFPTFYYLSYIVNVTHQNLSIHQQLELNAYMLVHNNLFTHMWLECFIGKLKNEKWKKNLQTIMLWTYGLGCCVNWQIAPYTIYDVMTICTCTLPLCC